ncbi:twin transmembrane helix small protein [Mangrovicoccus algicola]|uniref:Twin transmembrane helix small protein n=1 Tax=Mangrovicoccus algicola TaxID=2771008 RepID=A0A8J7CKL4_9RHOB|nr:twin transmembrane helix small protein [Mangrovicoccus algicola]MBE3638971.1 twin transmembrane helix small protein [Mangrovicoccus algicola]
MAQDPLFLLAGGACLLVLIVLMIGIGGFARGGAFNRRHGNRLMRYRLAAQAVAVALILLFVAIRGGIGG